MSVNNNFPFAPQKVTQDLEMLRQLKNVVNSAMNGKINCTGDCTITASAAATTINDKLCNVNSVILLQPTTAHAAAEAPTLYTVAGAGQFVLHHANNSQIDRIFKYVIIG